MSKLLCIDIGNSRIKVGLFEGDTLSQVHAFRPDEALETSFMELAKEAQRGIVLSSVVPSTAKRIKALCQQANLPEPYEIDHTRAADLKIDLNNPETLGQDRLSAAAGAYARAGAPVVVADAGTATTTTVVAPGGRIVGGTIMPGIRMMLKALHENTAALPEVEPFPWTGSLGRDTRTSIMAGVVLSTAGMIESVLKEVEDTYGRAALFVTGGQAELLAPLLPEVTLEPNLTLYGMKYIFDRRHK